VKYPNIISVRPTSDYNVILTLENGIIKKFDVKPYISGAWFGKLKDKSIFNTVHPCGNNQLCTKVLKSKYFIDFCI